MFLIFASLLHELHILLVWWWRKLAGTWQQSMGSGWLQQKGSWHLLTRAPLLILASFLLSKVRGEARSKARQYRLEWPQASSKRRWKSERGDERREARSEARQYRLAAFFPSRSPVSLIAASLCLLLLPSISLTASFPPSIPVPVNAGTFFLSWSDNNSFICLDVS